MVPQHGYKQDRKQDRGQCAIGFFSSLSDAEYGVTGLRSVNFPLNQIMLVATHFRRQDQFAEVDLHSCLETVRLKISAEQANFCQARLNREQYMIIVHGTEDELKRAASILTHHKLQEWRVYSPTDPNPDLNQELAAEKQINQKTVASRWL